MAGFVRGLRSERKVVTADEYIGQDAAVAILELKAERDEAVGLIRELRANHRRPFGGWAPYDLPARVDDFLARCR